MKPVEMNRGDVYNTDEYWQKMANLSELAEVAPENTQWTQVETGEGFDAEAVQNLGTELVGAVEREIADGEANDIAEAAEAESEVSSGTEGPELESEEAEPESPELEEEPKTGREDLDKWRESMAGTPEEYWQKLEDDWWINEEVPMSAYAAPKIEVLQEKAKEILKEQVPGLDEAGIATRAEMATKVALQELAEREAEMITQTKMNRKGERKLEKGWDEKLLHRAYSEMRNCLLEFYKNSWVKADATGEDLSENEEIAWRAALEPQAPGTLNMRILLEQYPRREEESADEYYERLRAYTRQDRRREEQLQADAEYEAKHPKPVEPVKKDEQEVVRLKPDEVEIVEEPKPLAVMEDVASEEEPAEAKTGEHERAGLAQRVWQKLRKRGWFARRRKQEASQAEAALEPEDVSAPGVDVTETTEVAEVAGAVDAAAEPEHTEVVEKRGLAGEKMSEGEMVERSIDMIEQAKQTLNELAGVLEDHNPLKAEMALGLDTIEAELKKLKGNIIANKSDFDEGKKQKEAGLTLDETDVGDSDIWRRGELALEALYANGLLKREQSAQEKLESLSTIDKQLDESMLRTYEKLKIELQNYEEYAKKVLAAKRYLIWAAKQEKAPTDVRDDVIVDFPSDKTLKKMQSV